MIKKTYVFRTTQYDYFAKGTRTQVYKFDSPLAMLKARREQLKHEYDYDDSWFIVNTIIRNLLIAR